MNKYETKVLPTIKLTSKSGEYDLCEHDYNLLVATGMLWELFPDAPDVFPSTDIQHEKL